MDFNTLKGNLNDIIDALQDIIDLAAQATTALGSLGSTSTSSLAGSSTSTRSLNNQSNISPIQILNNPGLITSTVPSSVNVSIGPVTINTEMDMSIFEAR